MLNSEIGAAQGIHLIEFETCLRDQMSFSGGLDSAELKTVSEIWAIFDPSIIIRRFVVFRVASCFARHT